MPTMPLPPELAEYLLAPRPAVVGTVRPDGRPSTTPSWFTWENDRLLLSMVATGPRARNVRHHPTISLTVLGDDWYDHVSLLGTVTAMRDDPQLADLDQMAMRYWGTPYPKRELRCVTAVVEIDRWHAWGKPADSTPS